MLFTLYTSSAVNEVKKMLQNHKDYAPENICEADDEEYFSDISGEGSSHSSSYIMRKENGDIVCFLTMQKSYSERFSNCWHITSLFVSEEVDASTVVFILFQELKKIFGDNASIYVNVHPEANEIKQFWESNDFLYSPEMSLYLNCNDVRLMAYSKRI